MLQANWNITIKVKNEAAALNIVYGWTIFRLFTCIPTGRVGLLNDTRRRLFRAIRALHHVASMARCTRQWSILWGKNAGQSSFEYVHLIAIRDNFCPNSINWRYKLWQLMLTLANLIKIGWNLFSAFVYHSFTGRIFCLRDNVA